MHYLWWIPCTIAFYSLFAWFSNKSNLEGGTWPWVLYVYGALCPFWVLATRVSKDLLFDGLVYDFLMIFAYSTTIIILGNHSTFDTTNWIGVLVVIIGLVLMRVSI